MGKKWIIVIGVIAVIIIIAGVWFAFMCGGPDLKKYEYLKEPQISSMPAQKMLAVEAKGDPNIIGKEVFSALYKTYYSLKGKVKDLKWNVAPRARWSKDFDPNKEEWVGIYGIPVPDSVDSIPEQKAEDKVKVQLTTWEYGDVAEILHIGPYSEEAPTIEKLHNFIKDKGFKIIGDHEEDYIKGPGMFGKGNPKKYYTIIRYRISKK